MKVRLGFVTNSSSSSFLICKKELTKNQIDAIRNHSEMGKRMGMDNYYCQWTIEENDDFIIGKTCMDNFYMPDFFDKINVHCKWWSEYPFSLSEAIDKMNNDDGWVKILEDIRNGVPYEEEEELDFED